MSVVTVIAVTVVAVTVIAVTMIAVTMIAVTAVAMMAMESVGVSLTLDGVVDLGQISGPWLDVELSKKFVGPEILVGLRNP